MECDWKEGCWEQDVEPEMILPFCQFDCDPSPLDQVRDWIRRQRFIPYDLSDEFLQRFLDVTNDNVDLAVAKIKKYFYLRQEPWPIFRDRSPLCPSNQSLFGQLYVVPITNLYNDSEVILLTGNLEMSTKYSLLGHLKLIALTVDYLLWDRKIKFQNLKIILDGKNFTCPALLENPYRDWACFVESFEWSLPVNFKGFYFLRPPHYIKEIVSLYDGMWLTMFETPREVTSKFPATILPFEFGGSLGLLDEVLDTWNLQLARRSKFMDRFEKRMINDYRRRLCHEREVREGGRNWVSRMKLVADESEYKKCYYHRIAHMKPLVHPAFGQSRRQNAPKEEKPKDPLEKCRRQLESESESDEQLVTQPTRQITPQRRKQTCVQLVFYVPECPERSAFQQ